MFTHDEMRFLRDCSPNEIMDEIIHKMTLVNCNGRPVMNMTRERIALFEKICAIKNFSPQELTLLTSIFNTQEYVKPQILVTIEGGCVQYATANMDVELVIDDVDNIKRGDDLDYPCLAGTTQEEFDKAAQTAYEQVLIYRAKQLKNEPVNSVRIFIHDHEDQFPFNVMVDDEVIATYKTFEEAFTFLQEYLKARKV